MPPIPAPLRTQTRAGSLLTTATVITSDQMRESAYEFTPELCGPGATARVCQGDSKGVTATSDMVSFLPYFIYQGAECERSSGPDTFTDTRERAFRGLEVNSSYLIEKAFWTGKSESNVVNHGLADTDAFQPNGRTAVGLTTGVQDIIGYFNDTIGGTVGMIHVEQRVVPYLMFYGLAERNGNVLQVRGTDHVFVAGTGYPGTDSAGTAPAAGESWMYGTTPVEVRMTPVFVPADSEAETLNRQTNNIQVRAERLAVAYWDECAHVGTAVCLEEPGPACEAGS